MKFENPVILSDYSDPDAIRYKDTYYMKIGRASCRERV